MKATTKFCPPSFICSYRYRFLELKYRRTEQIKGEGITKPARFETVVIFLPDIYSCMPNRSEWDTLQQQYKEACEKFLSDSDSDDDVQIISGDEEKSNSQDVVVGADVVSVDNSSSVKGVQQLAENSTSSLPVDTAEMTEEAAAQHEEKGADESAMLIVIVATVISSFFCLDHT